VSILECWQDSLHIGIATLYKMAAEECLKYWRCHHVMKWAVLIV